MIVLQGVTALEIPNFQIKFSTAQIAILYIFTTSTPSQLSMLRKNKHWYLVILFVLSYGAVKYRRSLFFHHLRRPYCIRRLPGVSTWK